MKMTQVATNLEVVGQLSTPSVARVHGDEDGAGGVQRDLCPLKHKHLTLLSDPTLNGLHLLSNHRQNLEWKKRMIKRHVGISTILYMTVSLAVNSPPTPTNNKNKKEQAIIMIIIIIVITSIAWYLLNKDEHTALYKISKTYK